MTVTLPFLTQYFHRPMLDVLQCAELGTDKDMMNESISIEVSDSMRVLAEKERVMLELYFGLKNQPAHSLEDIGAIYHLTRERVRQKLKTYLG